MSSNPQNKVSVWGVAIGGSVLIHFVLLGLLAMTAGGNSAPPEPPAPEPPPPAAESAPAQSAPQAPQPPRQTPRSESAAVRPAVEQEVVTYVVKQGDNLTRIARSCGSTVVELAELNGKPVKRLEKLWVGQKIKLPRPISEQQ